jgi:putative membrane protein
MSERAFQAMAAGGLALAFAIAPISALHSQSKPGTWGTTPGSTNPGTTTTGAPTGTTPGQTTPTTTTPTTTSQSSQGDIRADAAFIREAASSNLMEVQLGQTAQTKASNNAVKQLAQRMVNDHTSMENQLASLAASNGLALKQTLTSEHEAHVKWIGNLSGQSFDSAYMNLMVQAHEEDIANFQTQSRSARSAQVRTLATNSLPVLMQHLRLAQQVRVQIGMDSTTTVASDTTSTTVGGKQTGGNANVRADAEFIRDVGAGNAMFVQLSEMAQKKAKDQAVKQFADRTRSDFENLQNQWSNMASNNDMKMTSGMGKRHHEKIETLQKSSGKNFDKTYMTIMVQQLHDRVTYWQKEGRASKSARVRNLVNRGLPTLEQRYTEAQQVARQVGVNPDAALRNRTDIASSKDKDKDKDK